MGRRRSDGERVVITGMGCVTPLGLDVASSWQAASTGQSGIRPIRRFDTSDLPVSFAGELPGTPELGDISPKELRRLDPAVQYSLAAARQAIADAGLEIDDSNRDRIGTAIGSGVGGLTTIANNQTILLEKGPRRVSPFTIPMGIANMAGGYVSIQYGLRGPSLCHVSACSSASHSIGEASRLIARGEADTMVTGGTEAPLIALSIASFAAMRALSERNDEPERASRPFDRARDGFVMGEGAAVFVLESLARAKARGAPVRAEILGYGASADAQHIAAPDLTGEGATRCMRIALEDAGLAPGEIGYVNAHATSTPAGDPAETTALHAVFGNGIERIPVSATKSMTGHLLGAAGAVEALFCVKALQNGLLPQTTNLEDVDPECDLDHIVGSARKADIRTALSNSFGFGGTNACLIFGHADA